MNWDNIQLLLVMVGVFVLPLAIGHYISKAVRMPDQSWRIATVLFSFFAAAAVTWYGWPPKLGIDLSGGSILVYEVDDQAKDPGTTVDMDKLVQAVTKRVNPGGVKEVTIRPYGVEPDRDHHPQGRRSGTRPHQEQDQLDGLVGIPHHGQRSRSRQLDRPGQEARCLDQDSDHGKCRRHERGRGPLGASAPEEDDYFTNPRSGFVSRDQRQGRGRSAGRDRPAKRYRPIFAQRHGRRRHGGTESRLQVRFVGLEAVRTT